jgi:hypothetical protein
MEEPGAVNPSTLRVQLVTQVWFGLERTLQLDSMERLTGNKKQQLPTCSGCWVIMTEQTHDSTEKQSID